MKADAKQASLLIVDEMLLKRGTFRNVAKAIKVSPNDVWRAVNKRYVSPKLAMALRKSGRLKAPINSGQKYDTTNRTRAVTGNLPPDVHSWLTANGGNATATALLVAAVRDRQRGERVAADLDAMYDFILEGDNE